MRAVRTAGSAAGRPSAWLYHCSPVISAVFSASMPAAVRRAASGPMMPAALISPLVSWLAAVVSLVTTLASIAAGVPVSDVVAPPGPQA